MAVALSTLYLLSGAGYNLYRILGGAPDPVPRIETPGKAVGWFCTMAVIYTAVTVTLILAWGAL